MKTFKLTVEYDGTDFSGWQVQPKGERTVQGALEAAFEKLLNKRVRVVGSGRTDAGVHAKAQVAHVRLKTEMSPDKMQKALNHFLPKDVVVLDCAQAGDDFHAQYSPKSKTYCYRILNRKSVSALERRTSYFFPHKLNVASMKREAKSFMGKKDFTSFANVNPSHKGDAIRCIKRLSVVKKGDVITLTVEANGFLYKMVRNIVGALLEVGSGRLPEGSVKKILAQKDRRAAGYAVPPQGLFLKSVTY